MGCHEAAPHERLFGLQTTKALVEIPRGNWNERVQTPGVEWER